MLDPDVYGSVVSEFGTPTIDLFACRLNKQCPVYASWQPDHDATFVDAFSANWNFFFYAFPPFSFIGRCLKKIQTNRAEGILVVHYTLLDQPKLVFQTTANVSESPTADQQKGETTNAAGMQSTSSAVGKNWTC